MIYVIWGEKHMIKVEIFDEEHEKDLQVKINEFLKKMDDSKFIDIKYAINAFLAANGEQIYCYSATIIYRN